MALTLKKAAKQKGKATVALFGASHSGKSYTALKLAQGLAGPGGKIAALDTENSLSGEANKEGMPDFDVAVMEPPYSIERYLEFLRMVQQGGYDVGIIDSFSHMWMGAGGALQRVDEMAQKMRGGSQRAWGQLNPKLEGLVSWMAHTPFHLIVTMRANQKWVDEEDQDSRGMRRAKTRKMTIDPVMRKNIEYEFGIVFELDPENHYAKASKDRTELFDGMMPRHLTAEDGESILKWANSGVDAEDVDPDRKAAEAEAQANAAQATPKSASPENETQLIAVVSAIEPDSEYSGKLLKVRFQSGESFHVKPNSKPANALQAALSAQTPCEIEIETTKLGNRLIAKAWEVEA